MLLHEPVWIVIANWFFAVLGRKHLPKNDCNNNNIINNNNNNNNNRRSEKETEQKETKKREMRQRSEDNNGRRGMLTIRTLSQRYFTAAPSWILKR